MLFDESRQQYEACPQVSHEVYIPSDENGRNFAFVAHITNWKAIL